jgi:hypothetical protein
MAGRGPQSFKKRQKEQARKEKQQEKASRREQRKANPLGVGVDEIDDTLEETDVDELSTDEIVARLVGGPIER